MLLEVEGKSVSAHLFVVDFVLFSKFLHFFLFSAFSSFFTLQTFLRYLVIVSPSYMSD